MKLRALHRYNYDTRELNPGDEFEADDNDAELIVTMGQAERLSGETSNKQPPASNEPPQQTAEPSKPDGKRGRGKGRYERRDLRAQD